MTTMNFSELCSRIERELRAVEDFYDDPMTQHYGAYDCALLVEKGMYRRVAALLEAAGSTPAQFLREVERRTNPRFAARVFGEVGSLINPDRYHRSYAAGYAYACGYHD